MLIVCGLRVGRTEHPQNSSISRQGCPCRYIIGMQDKKTALFAIRIYQTCYCAGVSARGVGTSHTGQL